MVSKHIGRSSACASLLRSHYTSQSYYASSNANSLDLALSLVHGADALTLTRIHRPNDEHGAPHTVFAPAS